MGHLSRVRLTGPLAGLADGFGALLAELGYTPLSAANQLRVMARLSRWLAAREEAPAQLDAERVEEFLADCRASGYTSWLSVRGLAPLLGYLRGLGVVPGAVSEPVATAAVVLLDRYGDYLAGERGLAASTIGCYVAEARLFLGRACGPDLAGLGELTAARVCGYVAAERRRRSTGSAKILVTALRSLLRFLFAAGLLAADLTAAVPAVAGWRGAGLPKALPAGHVAALLGSCDRGTTVGMRDFAVLTLLARLGLRACEVAAMELDDIGWRAGEIVIRGKGGRDERMPLPADVGQALAGYLRDGRPAGGGWRAVFLRACAPAGPLSAGAVKQIVRSRFRRAGLPEAGTHRLRHTAATQMLRAGSPLAEVGQVLRHRSTATTAIYAKVDHAALAVLALPWPGGRP
jgi:site-specific recombinase XerD